MSVVTNTQQLRNSIAAFNQVATGSRDVARRILRSTWYWVYDPNTKKFGPNKFVGFACSTMSDYNAAIRTQGIRQIGFDGNIIRLAVESVLGGAFADGSAAQHGALVQWGESLIGSGVFKGINTQKWKFLALPALQHAAAPAHSLQATWMDEEVDI